MLAIMKQSFSLRLSLCQQSLSPMRKWGKLHVLPWCLYFSFSVQSSSSREKDVWSDTFFINHG